MVKKMIDVIKILKKENKYNERIKTLVQELLRFTPFMWFSLTSLFHSRNCYEYHGMN